MRDTVFGLLLTCPQRRSSLLPTSPPGTQRVLITQRTITSTSLKTAAGQGPPAVFRFRVFAARPLLIVKYGLKTAGGE